MQQATTQPANHIEQQEFARPEVTLQHRAEHPHGKEVEEDVGEVGVHKHIGEELCHVEIVGKEEVQRQVAVKVDAPPPCRKRGEEEQDVDHQYILRDNGKSVHQVNI